MKEITKLPKWKPIIVSYIFSQVIPGLCIIGVTSNLERRLQEHKQRIFEWFSKKYNCHKLVYMEQTSDMIGAITREKQLKNYSRKKKELLIWNTNPTWEDLSQKW